MLALLKKDVLRRLQPGATPFLYRMPIGRQELELCPGVADALRRFHGLLTDTIQARWTAWIEQRNPQVRGSDALREHLFGIDRIRLRAVVRPLLALQDGRCFYSGMRITERTAEVDHVLPWSLTRNNSVGNLVLASKRANLAKGDRLPTVDEAKRWIERNRDYSDELARIADVANLEWRPEAMANLTMHALRHWQQADGATPQNWRVESTTMCSKKLWRAQSPFQPEFRALPQASKATGASFSESGFPPAARSTI
jgi:5-methylcytosine-specific restriction endonuclease McrA